MRGTARQVITSFSIEKWCAFTLNESKYVKKSRGVLLNEAEALNVSFLPPMSRRRMSRLSKLALRLAHECVASFNGCCVFGSQHGELPTTQKLLREIICGEIVSPAGFSASVHNTAAGLYSIHNNNKSPCSSVAAGLDTLMMCIWEAAAVLKSKEVSEVLVVYADDKVPSVYEKYLQVPNRMYGLAALISTPRSQDFFQVAAEDKVKPDMTLPIGQAEQLSSILDSTRNNFEYVISGEVMDWKWRLNG